MPELALHDSAATYGSSDHRLVQNDGYLWWLNTGRGLYPSASARSYYARGAGGNLTWIDGATHHSAVLRHLRFSYDSATITGQTGSPAKTITLANVGGDLSGGVTAAPSPTQNLQTFEASDVTITASGAKWLNTTLKTTMFKAGADIGSFGASYTFNIPQ